MNTRLPTYTRDEIVTKYAERLATSKGSALVHVSAALPDKNGGHRYTIVYGDKVNSVEVGAVVYGDGHTYSIWANESVLTYDIYGNTFPGKIASPAVDMAIDAISG